MKNKAGKKNESSNEKGLECLRRIIATLTKPVIFFTLKTPISHPLVKNSNSQPIINQWSNYFFPLFSLFPLKQFSALKPLIFRDRMHFTPIFAKTALATHSQSTEFSLFPLFSAKIFKRFKTHEILDFSRYFLVANEMELPGLLASQTRIIDLVFEPTE